MEEFDLIVIGAGIYGLPMAKTFHEIHPNAPLLILDAQSTVGGTWAAERIYPDMWTNNLVGTYEYGDFPMDFETFGVAPGSHIPGSIMHKYLTAYAQYFDIFPKMRFNSQVKTTKLLKDDTWEVEYVDKMDGDKKITVKTKKLVLATGLTSSPNMPAIEGAEKFGGEIFHSKDLPARQDVIKRAKSVVVLGGSKSAADAVYINATRGKHVDWIIRESGRGASWFTYSHVSPMHLQFEKLATTRFFTFLSPCFDSDSYTTVRYLLHNTFVGRAFVKLFFSIIDADLTSRGKYNDHPDTKKLLPRNNVFWSGQTVGILNHPNSLFALIQQGKVHVHNADITSLSNHTVRLSDKTSIEADVLICCTGWKHAPTIQFFPESLAREVGIYHPTPGDPTIAAADKEILKRFPELRQSPATAPDKLYQPFYTLYQGAIPPYFLPLRNLAYTGAGPSLRACLLAEIHALWISAFFDNKLVTPVPSVDEAEWHTMLQSRFYRWKAPNGSGFQGMDLVFETIPFIDCLLNDLGLETKRKGGWREIFEWYGGADYKGLVGEWKQASAK